MHSRFILMQWNRSEAGAGTEEQLNMMHSGKRKLVSGTEHAAENGDVSLPSLLLGRWIISRTAGPTYSSGKKNPRELLLKMFEYLWAENWSLFSCVLSDSQSK